MKKIAAAMLSLGLLAGSCTMAAAAEPEVYYNGQPLEMHQPAIIQEGRTLLALRDMAEQMQVTVQWDSAQSHTKIKQSHCSRICNVC